LKSKSAAPAVRDTLSDSEFQPVWDAFLRKDLIAARKLFSPLKHKTIPKKTALYFTASYVKMKLGEL
jgi:hypothetical protein